MPRFNKPPIVEAWVAFDFESKQDKVAWDMQRAEQFVKLQSKEFPKIDVLVRQETKLEATHDGKLPTVVSQDHIPQIVRMWNETSSRVLQISDDRMAYNLLEGGANYPGFATLVDEALNYLNEYRSFFQPSGIQRATIHHRDVVTIPVEGRTMDGEDFFRIVRDLDSDPFGLVAYFDVRYVTKCPIDGQFLEIRLARIPPALENTIRFCIDWEKPCEIDFGSPRSIRDGLYESHEFMVECFEASITPRTRMLFEPTTPAE